MAITPKTWNIEGKFFGEQISLEAHAQRYADNGRIAIPIFREDEEEGQSLFTMLTVNAPNMLLWDEDAQVIIDPNVTKETLKMVIDSGLLEEEPVMDMKLGMSTTQAYELTDKAMDWIEATAPRQTLAPATELLDRIGISSSSIDIQAEQPAEKGEAQNVEEHENTTGLEQ
ncbi:hypothetical protein [Corynebacterium callunae]|uniref:Uncharacterized protein n=1 Tax=Corynebacterium callunae DSM 20147 TaxID=1121353 RepID=M1UXV8_9CORY|nr:hypothetical protein [Corynebacterium callunae]AGG66178.1 hypothetical protein H924_03650 [Corynebacterium callunae DSM 20147]